MTTGDAFHGRLLVRIRETVAKFAIFREGSSHSVNTISLVSIDLYDDDPGSGAAISVLLQVIADYGESRSKPRCAITSTTHKVVTLGRTRAEMAAQNILASYSEFLARTKLENPECSLLSER